MTMFYCSYTWRCQTNDVDTCYEHGVGLTQHETWQQCSTVSLYIIVLRPDIVACTQDVNRHTLGLPDATPYQGTYKGSFWVCLKACFMHKLRWDLPLST
jgi:hypothetical protein